MRIVKAIHCKVWLMPLRLNFPGPVDNVRRNSYLQRLYRDDDTYFCSSGTGIMPACCNPAHHIVCVPIFDDSAANEMANPSSLRYHFFTSARNRRSLSWSSEGGLTCPSVSHRISFGDNFVNGYMEVRVVRPGSPSIYFCKFPTPFPLVL